jgi:hypothetical protein
MLGSHEMRTYQCWPALIKWEGVREEVGIDSNISLSLFQSVARFTIALLDFLILHPKEADCDKGLFFEKRVHSAANTETGEKREGRSAGAAMPAFISLGLRQPVGSKLTDLSTRSFPVSQ